MAKKKQNSILDQLTPALNQLKSALLSVSDIKLKIPNVKMDLSKKSSSASKNKKDGAGGIVSKISSTIISSLSQYSVQQEEVVGIDITPEGVRLLQLSNTDDKWTVEKLAYRHIDRVEDIKTGSVKIAEEISIAYKAGRFTTQNAAVSLPVSSSIVKVITMPLMSDDEMNRAIEYDSLWENLTQLPDALEEYSIFYQTIRKDSASNTMDVLFVASKLSDVNQYVDIVKKANMNPVVLDVRCFALRNAFETKNMSAMTKAPLALLEIGNHENYLLILKEENPFVSDIFVGAKDKELIGIEQKDSKSLVPIIDRFAMQIKQNLDSYSTRFKTDKIESLFIVSQSPNVEAIVDIISKKFKNITVVLLDPFNTMVVPAQIKEKIDVDENKSAFTAVVGLATRKLDIFGYYKKVTGVKNINLLPNREGVRKSQRTKFISGFVLIGLVAILFVIGIWLGSSFYSDQSKNNNELIHYNKLQNQISELQLNMLKLKVENRNLMEGLKLSESATTNQVAAARVLVDLASKAGTNIALSGVSFDGNYSYVVNGQALSDKDVINYLTRIRDIPIFASVVLEKSSMAMEGSNIKEFLIKIDVYEDLMNAQNLDEKIEGMEN